MEETMWDVWYTHKGNIEMGPRWMVQYSVQLNEMGLRWMVQHSVQLNVVTNLQVSYKNKMEFLYQINGCQLLKEYPTP
jgi:hypothetical protein